MGDVLLNRKVERAEFILNTPHKRCPSLHEAIAIS
jgi:hypothetical protein